MDPYLSYTFCMKCGSEFSDKEKNFLLCQKCGYKFYITPQPCSSVIIDVNKEILLVKRDVEPYKGFLDLPGGFVNINETFEEAAVRELKEELGVKISKSKLLYLESYTERYRYQEVSNYLISNLYLLKLNKTIKLSARDDIGNAKFYDYRNIDFSRIPFGNMKKGIINYLNNSY